MNDQLVRSRPHRTQIDWLVNLGLTLFLAATATLSIHGSLLHDTEPALALTFATAAAMFAVILIPFDPASMHRVLKLLFWAILAGVACAMQPLTTKGLDFPHMLRLGGTVALFVFAVGGSKQAIAMRTNNALAIATIVLVALNFCAAPIFLGPVAEHLSTHRVFVDAIVNVSPVTHFATALGFDYLRDNWFYQYSRVGSIRFDYATPAACVIGYGLVCLVSQYLIFVQLRQLESTRR